MRKKEGFNNQLSFVLPSSSILQLKNGALTKLLYMTDVGYYPDARYHYRERQNGCDQTILIWCVSGNGWIEWGRNRKSVEKDTVVIIPASVPHKYGSSDDRPWSIYWVHYAGAQADVLTGTNVQVMAIGSNEGSRNDRRIRLFHEVFMNLSMGYSRENLDYSSLCLWYLLGSFFYVPQFERIRSVSHRDAVERAIVFMTENLSGNLTLNEITSYCGYSVSHFSKLFKEKTGKAPFDYYIGLKIQQACQMLDLTHMQIRMVASELGFEDPFYFSRIFKKIMGVSPAEYRKNKKG